MNYGTSALLLQVFDNAPTLRIKINNSRNGEDGSTKKTLKLDKAHGRRLFTLHYMSKYNIINISNKYNCSNNTNVNIIVASQYRVSQTSNFPLLRKTSFLSLLILQTLL